MNFRPQQATRARQQAYAFLADVFEVGVQPSLLPRLRTLPMLTDVMTLPSDADELAAEHHRIFSLEVQPLASVFLSNDGRPGGSISEHARLLMAGAFTPDPPDHVATQLRFLSGAPEEERVEAFLDKHLLWWLPSFVYALRRQRSLFFSRVAALTLDVVLDHREQLPPVAGTLTSPLPPIIRPLENSETRLRDIAAHLCRPARCGLHLSRSDIAELARPLDLPSGFGGRVQMMTNVLEASVRYDALPALLDSLIEVARQWKAIHKDTRELRAMARAWAARLDATEDMLRRIREESTA